MQIKQSQVFYGWRIAAAAAGLQFIHAALFLQAFGAYVAVLSQEMGWSKTALAGGAVLHSMEGALLGPLLGWLLDRFGPRIMVQGGVVVFAAGFMLLSTIETVPGFYAAMTVVALGVTFCSYFPLSVAIVRFFRRQRARALSVMSLGLAGGGLVLPVLGWAMEWLGWRQTAFASGVLVLVIGFPLACVIRGDPAEVGTTVDGDEVPTPVEGAAVWPGEFSLSQALRTHAFWLISLGHGLALLVVASVNVHAISHMKEGLGYSLPQATGVITLMTLCQGLGIVLGASLGDRWKKHVVAAGCMLAHMVGLLLLTFASHPAMVVAFAVLHGVAWGLRGPFMQALRADYFGVRSIGMILGVSAAFVAIGQVSGPLVAGALADLTGNYRLGFVVLALLAGSGTVLFLLAKKPVLPSAPAADGAKRPAGE